MTDLEAFKEALYNWQKCVQIGLDKGLTHDEAVKATRAYFDATVFRRAKRA